MDACSRRIIGWAFSERMTTPLVLKALSSALSRRRQLHRLIIHSDRGGQYKSRAYCAYLNSNYLLGSMSGMGNYYDNAMMERFSGTLKDHLFTAEVLLNAQQLHRRLAAWIEWIMITCDHTVLSMIALRTSLNNNYSNTRSQHEESRDSLSHFIRPEQ